MGNYVYCAASHSGYDNLALDEWFLDNLAPEDWLLYFYQNANAVIIGRNQNPWRECDLAAMERDGVELVRRITGGGAVYHDLGNLNYSFITGAARYDLEAQRQILLEALASLGLTCTVSGRNDLLADGLKISGSAFAARGQLRQHHGTLLIAADLGQLAAYLRPDALKLRAKGVASVRARVTNLSQLRPGLTVEAVMAAVTEAAARALGPFTPYPVDAAVWESAAPYRARQASAAWRLGKTPQFDLQLTTRFAWGGVELLLKLSRGTVERAEVYTDALDVDLAQTVAARLTGAATGALADSLEADPPGPLADLAAFLRARGL